MMIDPIQILLAFVISILTILLFIIGLGFFQILKELKRTLEKVNKILDDTGRITNSIATPIEEASEFLVGLKKGVSFINSISKLFKNKTKSSSKEDAPPEKDAKEKVEEAQEVEEIEEKPSKSRGAVPAPAKKKTVGAGGSAPAQKNKKRFFTRKGKNLGK